MEVGINFLPGAGTGIANYTKNLLIALGQQVESKVSAFVYGCLRQLTTAKRNCQVVYSTCSSPQSNNFFSAKI
jgi:hypothetical protein